MYRIWVRTANMTSNNAEAFFSPHYKYLDEEQAQAMADTLNRSGLTYVYEVVRDMPTPLTGTRV